ncbi:MAG: dihydropteroate synthase [Cyanobacteria bacterium]|nr:dihydropteroate synthase [Cyanobacteriota bacterium]
MGCPLLGIQNLDLKSPGTLTMGILNLTPDSFSDGGALVSTEGVLNLPHLIAQAQGFDAVGVDIFDVGGESTRPGASTVSIETELSRVIPAIETLRRNFPDAFISIDTRKARVAKAAIEAGASMINDVSGLQFDSQMVEVASETQAYLVIMHSQGTPESMQKAPHYQDVVGEVSRFLERQAQDAISKGVKPHKIILDPGFGFGKSVDHNLALLSGLEKLVHQGFPVLVGASRKSFLTLGKKEPTVENREALTAVFHGVALQKGAKILRVHDPFTQIPTIQLMDRLHNGISSGIES